MSTLWRYSLGIWAANEPWGRGKRVCLASFNTLVVGSSQFFSKGALQCIRAVSSLTCPLHVPWHHLACLSVALVLLWGNPTPFDVVPWGACCILTTRASYSPFCPSYSSSYHSDHSLLLLLLLLLLLPLLLYSQVLPYNCSRSTFYCHFLLAGPPVGSLIPMFCSFACSH